MIHVDALDFSECHSEEVISFFWRSVYISQRQAESDGCVILWGCDIKRKPEAMIISLHRAACPDRGK